MDRNAKIAAAFDAAFQHQRAGRLADAIAGYQRVLRANPLFASAWINAGVALRASGQTEAGVACLQRGVALKPDDAGARSNLGNALRAAGRLEEAAASHEAALERRPDEGSFIYNLGLVRRDLGELDAALSCFDRAEQHGYDKPDLYWDRALAHMLKGDIKQGFDGYEWRWKIADAKPRTFDQPAWTGEHIENQTLLVYAEQGFGDTIQFVRYLPLVRPRVKKVIFECQPQLVRLFSNSKIFNGIEIVQRDMPLPAFDKQVALLSLPLALGEETNTQPDSSPYVDPPPGEHAVAAPPGHLKVGLVWAGKPTHRNNRNRSVSLEQFLPLFEVPGTTFFSLQLAEPAAEIDATGAGSLIFDLRPYIRDFADSAAVLMNLDLMISVDTSIVHLAGALNRPVWNLLPYAPDWRWQLNRVDSPWYPSMRLFRPASPRAWPGLIAEVKSELERLAAARQPSKLPLYL